MLRGDYIVKKENSNERKNVLSKIYSILEEAKRQNLMDWGELEIAESVLHGRTKKD
jgi:hypothetical protein